MIWLQGRRDRLSDSALTGSESAWGLRLCRICVWGSVTVCMHSMLLDASNIIQVCKQNMDLMPVIGHVTVKHYRLCHCHAFVPASKRTAEEDAEGIPWSSLPLALC